MAQKVKLSRLEKLDERLRAARITHTNPVEISITDLEWLIEFAYAKNDKCRWSEQPEDLMVWDIEWLTSCGGSFGLDREEGKPSENDYHYCPKCGKMIEEVPIISEDEP